MLDPGLRRGGEQWGGVRLSIHRLALIDAPQVAFLHEPATATGVEPAPACRAFADPPDHAGLGAPVDRGASVRRSEEHTSELQSLMRISYAVFCLKKKKTNNT